jgi:hypothetical protein
MKELRINKDKRIEKSKKQIIDFFESNGLKVTDSFTDFFEKYEGLYLDESQSYYKNNDRMYEIHSILHLRKNSEYASVEAILEGQKYYGIEGYIPFAIDSGGWDYNVSINPETYGQVWVDKFDSGEENTMEFVADSFEEFINGLHAEDENTVLNVG